MMLRRLRVRHGMEGGTQVAGMSVTFAAVLRPAIVTIVLLIAGIALAHGLGGLAFLGVMLWAIILAGVAIGLFF
jgi:hypothetical protein